MLHTKRETYHTYDKRERYHTMTVRNKEKRKVSYDKTGRCHKI